MKQILCQLSFLGLCIICFRGCIEIKDAPTSNGGGKGSVDKKIRNDGSSTVYPISQAVAEQFNNDHSGINIEVAKSGTSGGFKKFIADETDINDASRQINPSEIEKLTKKNMEALELTIAIDGISIVVNKKNDWCNEISIAQLKKLWEPDSKITKWSELNPAHSSISPKSFAGK